VLLIGLHDFAGRPNRGTKAKRGSATTCGEQPLGEQLFALAFAKTTGGPIVNHTTLPCVYG
jgi:hypothetical protein